MSRSLYGLQRAAGIVHAQAAITRSFLASERQQKDRDYLIRRRISGGVRARREKIWLWRWPVI